jgi:ornithine cyclodeaminase
VLTAAAGIDAVAVTRDALLLHAAGRTTLPPEAYLPWKTGSGAAARSLVLPAALWGTAPALGAKIINSSLANPDRGLARAHGLTVLFDMETARPVAILEGAHLSALRTSAYTALSVDLLAVPEVSKVCVIGCGVLGQAHVRVLAPRLPGAVFTLYDQVQPRAAAAATSLAAGGARCEVGASAEHAVRDAEVVVTATTSTTGYLPHSWLREGALVGHVSLDDVLPDVVARSDLVFVDDWPLVSSDDHRLLGRMYRAGELAGPGGESFDGRPSAGRRVDGTLADVVSRRHLGRLNPRQIILSNPFGVGILDVALAAKVVDAAGELDLGIELDR